MATDKHGVATPSADPRVAGTAHKATQSTALPFETSPVTGNGSIRDELPALDDQKGPAVPSEARPVTGKWLTDDELPAPEARDRLAQPSEARPVTHEWHTDNELPARCADELPALEAPHLCTMPTEARPVTQKWLTDDELPALGAFPGAVTLMPSEARPVTNRDFPDKMTTHIPVAGTTPRTDPPGTRGHASWARDTPTCTHTPGTRVSLMTARPREHIAGVTLPSEARPVTGNWLTNDKLANRITGRGLLGNTWDLGATEAHPRTGNTVTPVDIAGMTHIAMPPRRNMTWTRISFILANADRHITETKARNGQDTQTSRGIDAPPHS